MNISALEYGRPVKPGDDGGICAGVLATAFRPSFASNSARKRRGRRESRVRAAPEVSCAMATKQKAHMSIQVKRKQSGLPCAMVLTAYTRSPWWPRGHHRLRFLTRKLDASTGASGPHDFAVRGMPSVHAHKHVAAMPRPPHPAPNVRDGHETPLLGARDGGDYAGDLRDGSRFILEIGINRLSLVMTSTSRGRLRPPCVNRLPVYLPI